MKFCLYREKTSGLVIRKRHKTVYSSSVVQVEYADFTRKLRQSRHFLLVLLRSPNCIEKRHSNSAKKQLKIIQININIKCTTTTKKSRRPLAMSSK